MENSQSSQIDSYTKTIKDTITALAGVAGIGYAAGFMVVSSSLMIWGITDLTLVKARYVSVGFLFIIHVTIVLAPAFLFALKFIHETFGNMQPQLADASTSALLNPAPANLEENSSLSTVSQESSLRQEDSPIDDSPALVSDTQETNVTTRSFTFLRFLRRIFTFSKFYKGLSPLLLILLIFCFTILLSLILLYLTSTDVWTEGRSLYFWNFLSEKKWRLLLFWYIPLFVGGLLLPLFVIKISQQRWLLSIASKLLLIGGILLVFLFAVRTYASEIYPRTTPALGGGDFYLVKFTTGADKAKTLAPLMYLESEYKPKWVWLLDQSDKSYFVLILPNGCDDKASAFDVDLYRMRAVEVPKSLVDGVIHYNMNLDFPAKCD